MFIYYKDLKKRLSKGVGLVPHKKYYIYNKQYQKMQSIIKNDPVFKGCKNK